MKCSWGKERGDPNNLPTNAQVHSTYYIVHNLDKGKHKDKDKDKHKHKDEDARGIPLPLAAQAPTPSGEYHECRRPGVYVAQGAFCTVLDHNGSKGQG